MTTLSDNTESDLKAGAARRDEEIINADAKDSAEAMSQEIKPTGSDDPDATRERRSISWSRVVAYGVLPGLALLLALAAGYFKWVGDAGNDVARARTESVRVASEDAVALLSYQPDTVDRDLSAARERLTGEFKDAYTALTREVVIPGAKEKHISAAAKVNAAASVSATANHAVVLLFVNQTVAVGQGVPTDTQPVIRVTLDKVNGRWLVSRFDPT